jgi:NADH:ubiquinone reductase (H+-translocating)
MKDVVHRMLTQNQQIEILQAKTILWAAGIQGPLLARRLAESAGAELDRTGRLIVQPDLTLPGYPEILIIGDLAHFSHQTGQPLPGVAQVAMQQGRYAANLIQARLYKTALPPFHYRDKGSMATIGRAAAVVDLGRLHFTGLIGWLLWLFIHLLYIVQFENRLLVMLQWGWSYFTRNRSARLITGEKKQD